jgi:hypothetical protein
VRAVQSRRVNVILFAALQGACRLRRNETDQESSVIEEGKPAQAKPGLTHKQAVR